MNKLKLTAWMHFPGTSEPYRELCTLHDFKSWNAFVLAVRSGVYGRASKSRFVQQISSDSFDSNNVESREMIPIFSDWTIGKPAFRAHILPLSVIQNWRELVLAEIGKREKLGLSTVKDRKTLNALFGAELVARANVSRKRDAVGKTAFVPAPWTLLAYDFKKLGR